MSELFQPIAQTNTVRKWNLMSFSRVSNLLHKITFGLIGCRDYIWLHEEKVVTYYPMIDDRTSELSRYGLTGYPGALGGKPPKHFNCRCG